MYTDSDYIFMYFMLHNTNTLYRNFKDEKNEKHKIHFISTKCALDYLSRVLLYIQTYIYSYTLQTYVYESS